MNLDVRVGLAVLAVVMGIFGLFLIGWFGHWAVAVGVMLMIWANNLGEK